MTELDKLINLMELAPITITEGEANRIIALLRTGAKMRSIIHLMDDPRDWKPAAKAWDAVLDEVNFDDRKEE